TVEKSSQQKNGHSTGRRTGQSGIRCKLVVPVPSLNRPGARLHFHFRLPRLGQEGISLSSNSVPGQLLWARHAPALSGSERMDWTPARSLGGGQGVGGRRRLASTGSPGMALLRFGKGGGGDYCSKPLPRMHNRFVQLVPCLAHRPAWLSVG